MVSTAEGIIIITLVPISQPGVIDISLKKPQPESTSKKGEVTDEAAAVDVLEQGQNEGRLNFNATFIR